MTVLKRLESLEQFGWRFGLESITALLGELGNPHLSLRCVHVAGSNGKGSTCAFLSSLLRWSGYKTGLYTSPHLCDIRERFRINGVWIDRGSFDRHAKRVLEACERVKKKLGHSPTHFEALTAMAFTWFKQREVDWLVLETGLGGRLDATNVIPEPALALLTPIGLEHQTILGKTMAKIAWEKAGILKKGCPAATLQPNPRAREVIEKEAGKKRAVLWVEGRDFKIKKARDGFQWEGPGLNRRFKLPGFPDYQIGNAGLALAGLQMLRAGGAGMDMKSLGTALGETHWPGRMEEIRSNPLVVIDGAHNPAAAKALALSLERKYPGREWIVLNGFLKDKDYRSFTKALEPVTRLSIVTEPPSGRRAEGDKVFAAWEVNGVPTVLVGDWRKALGFALGKVEAGKGSWALLITGSLYLGGSCRKVLAGTGDLREI